MSEGLAVEIFVVGVEPEVLVQMVQLGDFETHVLDGVVGDGDCLDVERDVCVAEVYSFDFCL